MPVGTKILWAVVLLALTFFLAGVLLWPPSPCKLDVYNWPYYIDPSVIAEFTDQTGCEVNYKEFPDNDTLYSAIANRQGKWDVIFPSTFMADRMYSEGLLQPIEAERIANLKNIDPSFLPSGKRTDDDSLYFAWLPYIWGSTGIGYLKSKYAHAPGSYAALLDNERRGRIAMLDDRRFVVAAALIATGHTANSTSADAMRDARDWLLKQKPLVRAYNSTNYVDLLTSGSVDVLFGYSGDILQAAERDPDVGFIHPREGFPSYVDTIAIPITCDEPELALHFVDFILEPLIAARIMNETRFFLPNTAAAPYVAKEIRSSPVIFPSASILRSGQQLVTHDQVMSSRVNQIWVEVKSR